MRPSAVGLVSAVVLTFATFALAPPAAAQSQQPAQPPAPEAGRPSGLTQLAAPPPAAPKPIVSKGEVTLYGIADMTIYYDSVQHNGGEAAGNVVMPREDTPPADRSRLQFSPRGSRIGLRLAAPEYEGIKVSGLAEADFVGNGQIVPGQPEAPFFTNPTFRIRHFFGKVATESFEFLFGQTWQLFGWIPASVGYSVMVAGLPGALYARGPQLRAGVIIKGDSVDVEAQIAAARPPERDASLPDAQAGLRFIFKDWKAMRTPGNAPGVVQPAFLGVSGIGRRFEVPLYEVGTTDTQTTAGYGVAVDAMIPLIPGKSIESHVGALTLTAEGVYGKGITDLYTGFTGGVTFPTTVITDGMDTMMPYTPNMDAGMVTIDTTTGDVEAVQWSTVTGGLQFYISNDVWLSANGSFITSNNVEDLTPNPMANVYKQAIFFDGCLAWNITSAARIGAEFGRFDQTYVNDDKATSYRVQFGTWYQF